MDTVEKIAIARAASGFLPPVERAQEAQLWRPGQCIPTVVCWNEEPIHRLHRPTDRPAEHPHAALCSRESIEDRWSAQIIRAVIEARHAMADRTRARRQRRPGDLWTEMLVVRNAHRRQRAARALFDQAL